MSVINRKFESNVAATQLTSIGATELFFSTEPDMSQHEGCVVQLDVNFVATPTDNMLVNVYARQDGTNYDIVPFMTFVIDKDNDPSRISFIIKDIFQFKVGIVRQGSTDTHTSADMDTRLWKHEVV